jgi:Ca2+ transporting ATPase
MENAFLRTPAESLEHFKVTEQTDLSQDAVVNSRKRYGPNGESTSTPTPEKH